MTTFHELGKLFKSLRMESGFTLREFCLTNKLNPETVSRIERGCVLYSDVPQIDRELLEAAARLAESAAEDDREAIDEVALKEGE